MSSFSDRDKVDIEACSDEEMVSVVVSIVVSLALMGSGGEGKSRVERHIALYLLVSLAFHLLSHTSVVNQTYQSLSNVDRLSALLSSIVPLYANLSPPSYSNFATSVTSLNLFLAISRRTAGCLAAAARSCMRPSRRLRTQRTHILFTCPR